MRFFEILVAVFFTVVFVSSCVTGRDAGVVMGKIAKAFYGELKEGWNLDENH